MQRPHSISLSINKTHARSPSPGGDDMKPISTTFLLRLIKQFRKSTKNPSPPQFQCSASLFYLHRKIIP